MMRRDFNIDVLKIICAQLIVWHHAILYAPTQLHWSTISPHLTEFLLEPGRWVVHVFLVIGGYLSAQALQRTHAQGAWRLCVKRYLRLMPTFMLAMCLTAAVGWWVQARYAPEFVSPTPSWWVWIAYLTLSFDVLNLGAISAGAWYVAIDFQLYVLLVLWVMHTRHTGHAQRFSWSSMLWVLGVLVSLVVISRQPHWDVWALYFVASYGMGCLVAWAQADARQKIWLWLALALWLFDLALQWRGRQALAGVTVLVLMWGSKQVIRAPLDRWVAMASDLSYPLFLGHFSLLILMGAWFNPEHALTSTDHWVYLGAVTLIAWAWALLLDSLLKALQTLSSRYFVFGARRA
jgi:peptidoglycan/LPS O-acetylase OafA/YrhL